jgi:hypothetical protein
MTVDNFTHDIIHFLGGYGGGIFGSMIAPNNPQQYTRVVGGLKDVETKAYMQVRPSTIAMTYSVPFWIQGHHRCDWT